jgi:hypothetical protein
MEEGRKNILGDLVISTTVGCAMLVGFLSVVCLIGFTTFIIVSILKNLY